MKRKRWVGGQRRGTGRWIFPTTPCVLLGYVTGAEVWVGCYILEGGRHEQSGLPVEQGNGNKDEVK